MTIESDMDNWGLNPGHSAMLERFRLENGRNPRLLAIGNIANNAFKNAGILRRSGVDCDVLCADYYHVMGCPEWEHAEFDTRQMDFNAPDWHQTDLGGYERPRWFAQGRLGTCLDYLIARNENSGLSDALWSQLQAESRNGGVGMSSQIYARDLPSTVSTELVARIAELFRVVFPCRNDLIDPVELKFKYSHVFDDSFRWKKLLDHYDCVVGYATDGIYPLIFSKRPYICFEHGTIRSFPFDGTLFGKLCALSYRLADDVLISNCDNIVAARKLGVPSFRFMPHAMLEKVPEANGVSELRDALLDRHDADFVVFHPSRQHWSSRKDLNWEKGNDLFIRGFADFVRKVRPKALLVMVAWGQTVDESRALVAELGIGNRVTWIEPLPMQAVARYVMAADALADQFVIGAWGGIMPHGMMLGTPTLLYLNEEVHRWCFPQMPPVLNVHDPEDICDALVTATRQEYRAFLKSSGPAWYKQFHSECIIAGRFLDSLGQVLQPSTDTRILQAIVETRADLRMQASKGYADQSWSLFRMGDSIRGLKNKIRSFVIKSRVKSPLVGGLMFQAARFMVRSARRIFISSKNT